MYYNNKLHKIRTTIVFIIIFMLGWLLNDAFSSMNIERPSTLVTGNFIGVDITNRPSPSDIIKQENIHVFSDRIIIYVDNPQWAMFTNTKSMDPVFDKEANALQIVPKSIEQINIGDIISFTSDFDDGIIIHRVMETGYDDDGWYALTKGDNNSYLDKGKRRFKDIKKILFGIIY
jgi:hypothetical protein